VHGVSPEETAMTGGAPDRIEKTIEFEKQALKEADLKVMVSSRMNSFFKEKYQLRDLPYVLVPCCVRSNEFMITAEERNRLRQKRGITNKFVILYLGTLSIWQWPDAMFNLFSQFHQANRESILYLMIPEYDHEKARDYIRQYELPEESYLLEEVAHQEVGKVIGMADAGLLLRESHPVNLVSSPTKFGEYLAAGVPVILTKGIGDYSAMAEELSVGITLSLDGETFPAEEQERLLQFTLDVWENRNEWNSRCIRAAKEKLDWTTYTEKLLQQYRSLVSD
jgi:glycosyltransferase involved in cell wall biosynthesis